MNVQEITVFFPAAVLYHESHMMMSMMDTGTRSPVLTTHTRQEDGHLHKSLTLEPTQYECLHLQEL